jgi:hypothetical protein
VKDPFEDAEEVWHRIIDTRCVGSGPGSGICESPHEVFRGEGRLLPQTAGARSIRRDVATVTKLSTVFVDNRGDRSPVVGRIVPHRACKLR